MKQMKERERGKEKGEGEKERDGSHRSCLVQER